MWGAATTLFCSGHFLITPHQKSLRRWILSGFWRLYSLKNIIVIILHSGTGTAEGNPSDGRKLLFMLIFSCTTMNIFEKA
jgi:hypothetical protein